MATTYISRTMGSATSRFTFTLSMWVKRSKSGEEVFWSSYNGNNYRFQLYFDSSDRLVVYDVDNGSDIIEVVTNRKFRDFNAWYHIYVAIKSSESTASDRCKIYVNGERETSFAVATYQSTSNDMALGTSSYVLNIGRYGGNTAFFSGLMSHSYYVDGSIIDVTQFGSIDSTTGEWKINTSPTIASYGNQGHLILKDGNSVTDQSPNTNNFTVGGGTLTKTEDNPSNVFCTLNRNIVQAGGVSGRHANVSASLNNGNTTGGEGSGVFSNQLGTIFASSGKYYAECKFGGDQYCHFGVTSPNFSDASLGSYPGDGIGGVNSAGIYGNGGIARCNGATIFTDSNITTDTICLAMDLDNGALYIRRNDGSWMNSGNPESGATKTGAITLPSDTYSWIVTSHNNSGSGRNYMKVNFGNGYFGTTAVSSAGTNASGIGIFEYDVPTGYTALCTKGLNL